MDARTCIRHAHANAAGERGREGPGEEERERADSAEEMRGGAKGAEDLDPRLFLLARIK